ncbi:MAG: hypothetical protein R3264_10630, partial [Anaerolineae bacterium]|nr:hypothetical protein [Anaerolineae bacterium]
PTALWEAGEIVVDHLSLPVDDVPLGEYSLVVGLYESTTLNRLPTEGNPANEIRLESISLP